MRICIQTDLETDVASPLIREALLDFADRRLSTWADTLDPDTYKVHWIEETSAEVTEGNRRPKLWSRERYDWSQPNVITWTTQESDFCAPGGYISMVITPTHSGGTHVEVTWDRTSVGLKGFVGFLVPGSAADDCWAGRRTMLCGRLQRGSDE